MDALALEEAEEVFGNGVVMRGTLAEHALLNVGMGKALTVNVGGVLDAAVRVKTEPNCGLRC